MSDVYFHNAMSCQLAPAAVRCIQYYIDETAANHTDSVNHQVGHTLVKTIIVSQISQNSFLNDEHLFKSTTV